MLTARLCVCPVCHASLDEAPNGPRDLPERVPRDGVSRSRGLACAGCKRKYPVVDGAPILVTDPRRYLLATARQYQRVITLRASGLEKFRAALKAPELAFREPVLRRLIEGSERNLAFLRGQLPPVLASLKQLGVKDKELAVGANDRLDVGYRPGDFNYFRADWSGDPDGERQIELIGGTFQRQAERYCDRSGTAVVLGAGAGRYAFDLARHFAGVVAVELSFSYVHGFHRLTREELPLSLIELATPRSRDDMVTDFTARLPDDRTPLERLAYVAADATRLPLPSGSVSTVVMAFFADVLPLPMLLEEIRRVLKPGGHVLNFGPLDYHFSDFSWLLAPEEAEDVIRRMGFQFEEQAWNEMEFFYQPRGYRRIFKTWSYALRAP